MPVIADHFKLDFEPVAAPEATVTCGNARFTVLTDRLIRLEYSPDNAFVDRASQAFWYRDQPVPPFSTTTKENRLEIETECLRLWYHGDDGIGFTAKNLAITVKSAGSIWHPGDSNEGNLLGTTRTLDEMDGYTRLEPGLLSRQGWSVIDDSRTLVFADSGWLQPRLPGGSDLYFFGYGRDYKACLRDYCAVSGRVPLIPRWALGNWWSRYWAYSQDELSALIKDFDSYCLPFSVCIVDMDWHITETGNESTGWTGYTWNRDLFPDPEGFCQYAHDRNLQVGLNLHPAEGVHDHEEQYEAMARSLGIDPASKQPVPFDITDPRFVNAYFTILHHPYEAAGVDFWWMDWQQGLKSKMANLDPLWLINHLHFYDLGREGTKRPFLFSRWGNEGHQRYPIGFSGDSYATWDSLNFQPYMTATASNIAYGWWSHDIGGHMGGTEDPELYARWMQLGVFSPINRIHATKGQFYDRRPWSFENAEVLRVLQETLQLRHAFIPYIYTMAHRAHDASLPLVQPMYYDYPEAQEAYSVPQQYAFGTELIAAPFVNPADETTSFSRQVVWLPEGHWYHFFSGEHFAGNRFQPVHGRLADVPLFAKAGAIVPLAGDPFADVVANPGQLHVTLFAGADNRFTLYEDDGKSTAYQNDQFCRTTITQSWQGDSLTVTIEKPSGVTSLVPAQRTYSFTVRGIQPEMSISITVDQQPVTVSSSYDAQTESLHIDGVTLDSTSVLQITIVARSGHLLAHRDRKAETLLRLLRHFRLTTGVRNAIAGKLATIVADPEKLAPFVVTLSTQQARALCEILFDAGLHHVADTLAPDLLILWNNTEDSRLTFRYNDAYDSRFVFFEPGVQKGGECPRFVRFIPSQKRQDHGPVDALWNRTRWYAQLDYANIFTISDERGEDSP